MKKKILQKNLPLLLSIAVLLSFSLASMYGAGFISGLYNKAFVKQCCWVFVGFIAYYAIRKINLNYILKYSWLFFSLGILSLILVLFLGTTVNGASSWFKIGPFSFQPSEIFKFFYLLHLAKVINNDKSSQTMTFLKILVLTFIPCLLIFLEPDTGVVLMYLVMMMGILLSSGIDKRYTIVLVLAAASALAIFFGLYFTNQEVFTKIFGISFFYRMDRLLCFKNSSSYQLAQALIGVGSSGLTGFGLTSKKVYVPEAVTDFAFDLAIMNFGILVGLLLALVYVYIIYKLVKMASEVTTPFGRVIISGTTAMMSFQVAEHILMNLGLTPITGITLPFFSYGGSSLLSYFLLFGLIMKITTNSSSYS